MADMGGVKLAYLAWQEALEHGEENYSEADIREAFGMSSSQLFFMSYAQTWCKIPSKYDEKDVHAPSPQRVLGPLANNIYFQIAFSCSVGSTYNPPQICEVW